MASMKRSAARWIDRISASVGKSIHVETGDGVIRSGRLTGLRTKTVTFNGAPCELITELELNNDQTDTLNFLTLAKIDIT